MSTSRILPIVNVAGCILITSLIVLQWIKERRLDSDIKELRTALAESRESYNSEHKRAEALQGDVNQLKSSIEQMMQAKKEFEEEQAKAAAEAQTQSNTLVTETQEQIKMWEKGIADRDEKIRELSSALGATRSRLDEAISQLKKAGAR